MSQLMHWLAMGGYSSYIWSAYGLVGVVLVVYLLSIKYQAIRMRKKLLRWFQP
jgi:heme exporter protein D